MLLLRREYVDGPESPELVLLHAEVRRTGASGEGVVARSTRVVAPAGAPGRRLAFLPVPEPGQGERFGVRYRFSAVRRGMEWYSPYYETGVPSDEVIADLHRIPEEGGGNLPPAAGRGHFRVTLPLAAGESASGVFRFGFGAMRKKPSPSLCRAAVDAGNGPAPVVEVPEALSVLKGRPMPYFLYHVSADGALRADKITSVRVVLRDEPGEVVSARMVWGDPGWRAVNLSAMEAKGFPEAGTSAADEFFAPDRDGFLAARHAVLSRLPAPRAFEAFVYGPSGSVAEYCFLVLIRRPDGTFAATWRNREGGGNWRVTL
jgi:hypothetical protein